ncbi:hypothetical protein KZZ52_49210 [Dactylosporangium sp. AC04546]|uniref:hypothetical protein n=1 Tax=Dactylosporangium sp. AC04546 TaxID=2862460 RepID=UPI001EDD17E6|nr:hypothetical protein [Dactylosporangium sp. AC04546]WVK81868.1 hypothetical protein KZZ52_49210 [Dactylosporangium sp. AC04546]
MDEDDMTRDGLPRFLDREPGEEYAEEQNAQSAEAAAAATRRTMGLLIAGGLSGTLIVALVVAALVSGGNTDASDQKASATQSALPPVVPEESVSPEATTDPSPSLESSSSSPSPSKKPTPSKTTSGPKGTVTSISLTLDPPGYAGDCKNDQSRQVTATLRIRVSQSGAAVTYTVDGERFTGTAQGTTYTRRWTFSVPETNGSRKVSVAVSAPSTTSASTTFVVRCNK